MRHSLCCPHRPGDAGSAPGSLQQRLHGNNSSVLCLPVQGCCTEPIMALALPLPKLNMTKPGSVEEKLGLHCGFSLMAQATEDNSCLSGPSASPMRKQPPRDAIPSPDASALDSILSGTELPCHPWTYWVSSHYQDCSFGTLLQGCTIPASPDGVVAFSTWP